MTEPRTTRLTISVFLLAALVCMLFTCGDAAGAAQAGPEALDFLINEYGPPVLLGQRLLAGSQQNKSDYQVIYGNGTAIGYTLAHSNLTPNSDTVYVGGIVQVRDIDYQIDYRQGVVKFARPVLPSEYFVVYYSYAKGDTGSRSILSTPKLALMGNDRMSVDFTYAHRAAVRNNSDTVSPELTTYGFKLDTRLGAVSNIKTMLYSSSSRRIFEGFDALNPAIHNTAAAANSERMVMHTGDFALGRLKLQATYQDVGSGFGGFMELRDSDAAPVSLLRKLEYEKGMKRMNLTMRLPLASAAAGTPTNELFWNTIEDPSGDYWAKGVDAHLGAFSVYAESRGSDPGFSKLAYLAYGAEWAETGLQIKRQFDPTATSAQVPYFDSYQTIYGPGVERSRYGVRYAAGNINGWLQAVNIEDQYGSIDRYSFNFADAKYNLFGFSQSVGSAFASLARLTDVEKEQFGIAPGVSRTDLGGSYKLNQSLDGTLTYSQFSSEAFSVATQSIGVKAKNYDVKVNFNDIKRVERAEPDADTVESVHTPEEYPEGQSVTVEAGVEKTVFKEFAGMQDGKVKLRVSTEEKSGENKELVVQSGVAKGNLTLEYSDLQTPYKTQVESKGIRFTSDRNPKKWLHFDVMYKSRADGGNDPRLVRSCSISAKINSRTNLSYSYYSNPEYYSGKMVSPIGSETLQFTTALRPGYNLVAYYRTYRYLTYKWGANSLNVALTGKLASGASFATGIARSIALTNPSDIEGKTLWTRYDHPVSHDRYLSFSALVTKWNEPVAGSVSGRDVEARVDFRTSLDILSK